MVKISILNVDITLRERTILPARRVNVKHFARHQRTQQTYFEGEIIHPTKQLTWTSRSKTFFVKKK